MTVRVREATADDASAVAQVHIDGWLAYRGLLPDEVIDDEAANEGCRERWQRQQADKGAEQGGQRHDRNSSKKSAAGQAGPAALAMAAIAVWPYQPSVG